ncbi:MAG: cation:dicarboxylase symporter family transporter, partial [Stenotrophomonas sp.]
MPLHIKVLLGFMLGTIVGLVAHATSADAAWVNTTIDYVTQPFGQIFLNLLFMLVVPLMFSA